ncbi:hypothetical protein ABT269_26730 [Streptomyces viridosporus]|uniref:Uncharacterized protein n=2 Tax=Streptomyces viridosporus TaxID=67581 RepID=A0ABX6ABC3_STRVD|nr:hypothetical protein [Streptomyces viridosporus]EFE70385.1 conserved hypothetical protein [Streptomyces viridosporus ATCC 14672]QEU84956.1 hypothetical protein CP969_09740 [Streptomyces viridosporus T7A]
MHAYDVPRRQPLASVPAPGRPAQGSRSGLSATPIYDALYTEYVKSFRALPGDRSGEEDLGFTAFGNIPRGAGPYGGHGPGSSGGSLGSGAYGAHGPGSTRQVTGQQPQWQRVGTVSRHATGMQHVPAGLPPAPRRGA